VQGGEIDAKLKAIVQDVITNNPSGEIEALINEIQYCCRNRIPVPSKDDVRARLLEARSVAR
jgi:hypothetical protein